MSNELVKYDNDLNDVSFIGFTAINYDVFMAVISRIRDKGTREMTFSFTDLRRLCNIEYKMSNDEFYKMLQQMSVKLNNLKISFETVDEWVLFTLFPTFRANKEKQTLKVKVNEDFTYMLNNFTSFTQFELSQFTRLKSKYSRTLFRKLKQFKSTGVYHVTLEEFKRLFDVPKTYSTKYMMDKIIKPCMSELSEYFTDLSVEVHKLPKRGSPVSGYTFKILGQGQIKGQMSIDEYALQNQKAGYKKKQKNESVQKAKRGNEREYDHEELQKKLLEN